MWLCWSTLCSLSFETLHMIESLVGDGSDVQYPGFVAARCFPELPLQVAGHCMLSIFDGTGAMSIGMALTGVPVVCPCEMELDGRLYALKNYKVLWRLTLSGRVRFPWLATPCRSWTMARSPMLRSWNEIFGCEWVLKNGSSEQRRLVNEGNALTWLTSLYILCIMQVGW